MQMNGFGPLLEPSFRKALITCPVALEEIGAGILQERKKDTSKTNPLALRTIGQLVVEVLAGNGLPAARIMQTPQSQDLRQMLEAIKPVNNLNSNLLSRYIIFSHLKCVAEYKERLLNIRNRCLPLDHMRAVNKEIDAELKTIAQEMDDKINKFIVTTS